MKQFIPIFVMAASSFHARAADFVTYSEASATAKQAGRNYVVFYQGPSWLSETAQVTRLLADPAVRKQIGGVDQWAAIPAEALSNEEVKKTKIKPDFIPYDLPAFALVDPEGKAFAVTEGVTAANFPQAIKALAAAAPTRERRDALFEKARKASGLERTKLFGQGLDQVQFRFSSQRKDILSEIAKADPNDASGYTFKYTFHASAFHERVAAKLIKEKKQAELFALVDKHLTNPVLLPQQRQALLSAKMQAYRSQDDILHAVEVLRKMVAIDPRSDLGMGAADYIRLLTEPVRLRGRVWEYLDNRPTWLPMIADVSDVIKEPGTYEIEFKHYEGNTRFRKVVLKSGDKEIVSEANDKESRKVKITVPESAKGKKIELWAESRGTGWFEARGEIVVTKAS